jgi:hypothetical protein
MGVLTTNTAIVVIMVGGVTLGARRVLKLENRLYSLLELGLVSLQLGTHYGVLGVFFHEPVEHRLICDIC